MSLAPGSRVGPYEIQVLLGAGGMGEVYRARDTRLGRDVALKTLPGSFTHDPERLARFRREAQMLAALNHPHIGAIYGLEEIEGHHALVLELVDGETLAGRIARGPLPVEEATSIARQTAEALLTAHDKGIVHRDLKPANIALTEHDKVKVLDFGLAKAGEAAKSSVDVMNSPTLTSPTILSGVGVVLGTAAYMSPEQAKGRAADKRSDVWAFGCVFFEMLAGRRAFEGEDVSDTIASVLRGEPDWNALPASLAPAIRLMIQGCLKKDRQERIADISTCLFILKQPDRLLGAPHASSEPRRRMPWMALLVLAVLAVTAIAVTALWPRTSAPEPPIARFRISLSSAELLVRARRAIAISPDGTRIVYSAQGRLVLRSLSQFDPQPIPGTDSAVTAAFSPDGQSIAYFVDGHIKRIAVTGGVPVTLCETSPAPFGITWDSQGITYIEPGRSIMRVSPDGGAPSVLVRLTPADGLAHAPQLLPDGKTLLFTLAQDSGRSSGLWDRARIVAQSLTSGQRKVLIQGGSNARYVPTGHIIYMVEGTLMAVPFNSKTLDVTGGPIPVIAGISRASDAAGGEGQFALSDSGTLVYFAGPVRAGEESLFLYDRHGVAEPLKMARGSYANPRVSPDGKWLALETNIGGNSAVGLYELSGESSLRRLTFEGNNRLPIWSGDGRHVVFQSDREGDRAIYWQPVDGGPAERLTRPTGGAVHVPEAWSPTDDVFLFSQTDSSSMSLWMFSMRDRKTSRFNGVTSDTFPSDAVFSPDGRWVAYQAGSSADGDTITYVQPYPPTGAKFEVARGGRPLWSRDGKEIFFIPAPATFAVVSVKTQPTFSVSEPVMIPRRFGLAPPSSPRPYDTLPDGRFVAAGFPEEISGSSGQQLSVTLNWFEELKARVPGR
jgi:serine/threonine protein kinase/Tol biopolymer transport system component